MARVLALYAKAPENGVVISFDQMGPISLRRTHGAGWAPRKRPERQRATFNRRHGVRYVMGVFDLHADHLRVRLRPRRAGSDNLAFLRQIRGCYPKRLRIHWIQDNSRPTGLRTSVRSPRPTTSNWSRRRPMPAT